MVGKILNFKGLSKVFSSSIGEWVDKRQVFWRGGSELGLGGWRRGFWLERKFYKRRKKIKGRVSYSLILFYEMNGDRQDRKL